MEKREVIRYSFIVGLCAVGCLFVKYFESAAAFFSSVLGAASPLLLGCVIAYVLNILMKQVERFYFPKAGSGFVRKSRRPVSILLSFLILFLIAVFVIKLVVPELISCVKLITDEIPPLAEKLQQWAVANSQGIPTINEMLRNVNVDWVDMVKRAVNLVATGAGGIVNSVFSLFSKILSGAAEFLIGSIFAIYLLSSKETLARQFGHVGQAYLKATTRKKIAYVLGTLHETFTNFIVGQCTEAVIIGGLCAGGMLLLRMPYAVMTGVVVGVTALIPVVGAYIGAVVGAFMVFTVNPVQALVFILFLVILQQLEGNLIYPKVVGSSIGLPGIWVLAAVTVGGSMMGIGGMLLGVPLAASAYKLAGRDVAKRLTGRK